LEEIEALDAAVLKEAIDKAVAAMEGLIDVTLGIAAKFMKEPEQPEEEPSSGNGVSPEESAAAMRETFAKLDEDLSIPTFLLRTEEKK
jgi:hypothetical protein